MTRERAEFEVLILMLAARVGVSGYWAWRSGEPIVGLFTFVAIGLFSSLLSLATAALAKPAPEVE